MDELDQVLNFEWVANVTNRDSGAGVKITANKDFVSAVAQKTQPYKNFPEQLRPALEKVAGYVRTTMIPRTFEQEGPGWKKLSKRSIKERVAQGYSGAHPILYRTGDLLQELTQPTHPKHIEIIKTGKYARVEIGGSSQKFIDNQRGLPSEHLPSRPMIPGTGWLPLPDKDKVMIRKILITEIDKKMKQNGK